jgi:hydrogenase small subunit
MMNLDKALALPVSSGGVPVVWLAGAACTGCVMSLLNSRFYTTIDDLLLNTLDLEYIDTAMATAGADIDGSPYGGADSVTHAQYIYNNIPYVLVVEGAIQAAAPPGGSAGDYCHIGDLTGDGNPSMLNVTRKFAANALAVLSVGTCSSFGGVPNGRGSATDAKGMLYKGTSSISKSQWPVGKGAMNDPRLGNATGAAATAGTVPPGTVTGGNDDLGIITTPTINIPGCPPHPDWIVGTIAHIVSTLGPVSTLLGLPLDDQQAALSAALPPFTSYYRPVDYGYREYQCNAGPCPWRYNNTALRNNQNSGTDNSTSFAEPDWNRRYPVGDSKSLGVNKFSINDHTNVGCLGILGCKGRKTKADCSRRRWNTDIAEEYGVNWCVGSRGSCHGCTEPTFPDKVGKFYTFR